MSPVGDVKTTPAPKPASILEPSKCMTQLEYVPYSFGSSASVHSLNHALVGGAGVLKSEGHSVEAEWPIWGNECCCGLVELLHFDLMVSRVCIEETQ